MCFEVFSCVWRKKHVQRDAGPPTLPPAPQFFQLVMQGSTHPCILRVRRILYINANTRHRWFSNCSLLLLFAIVALCSNNNKIATCQNLPSLIYVVMAVVRRSRLLLNQFRVLAVLLPFWRRQVVWLVDEAQLISWKEVYVYLSSSTSPLARLPPMLNQGN